MKEYKFRDKNIVRTYKQKHQDYKKYKEALQKDFNERCCYCNMPERYLTSNFQIDHFVPRTVFEGKDNSLLSDYNNLMWVCPKCNLLKGSKFSGDITINRLENKLFYNPVTENYNDHFYRNEIGLICGIDKKAQEMIRILKLYRASTWIPWVLERIENVSSLLEKRIEKENNIEKKRKLEEVQNNLLKKYLKLQSKFKAQYRLKASAEEMTN